MVRNRSHVKRSPLRTLRRGDGGESSGKLNGSFWPESRPSRSLVGGKAPCVKQPAATPRRVGRPLKYSVQTPFGSQVEVGQRLVSTQNGHPLLVLSSSPGRGAGIH